MNLYIAAKASTVRAFRLTSLLFLRSSTAEPLRSVDFENDGIVTRSPFVARTSDEDDDGETPLTPVDVPLDDDVIATC